MNVGDVGDVNVMLSPPYVPTPSAQGGREEREERVGRVDAVKELKLSSGVTAQQNGITDPSIPKPRDAVWDAT